MYAVIQSGGKQYRVQPGDVVQIEKLEGDVGSAVQFKEVLMVAKPSQDASTIWLGKPTLNGASVEGEIVGQGRGEKILIIKMKRRKGYRKTQGHRQFYTQILVTGLANGAGETAKLSAEDKKQKLEKFQSHLAPKGEAFTPKLLGSRKKRIAATAAAHAAGTTPKKAPAKKAAAKKAAAKK
jgi:large subunit ribosomal protein L21